MLGCFPPLALPKSGTVEDVSSSQPVTQAPALNIFLTYLIRIAQTRWLVNSILLFTCSRVAQTETNFADASDPVQSEQHGDEFRTGKCEPDPWHAKQR